MRLLSLILVLLLSTVVVGQGATSDPDADSSAAALSPAPTTLSREQIQDMIRLSAEKDLDNDKRQRDYTYIERQEEHKLNGKGEVGSTEIRTYEVLQIYNEQVRRLIAKDDKPLSAKDAAKEEEKIQKIIDKRKNESDSQREKRLKEEEKERRENREFVAEIADAYDFKLAGIEVLDGREAYMI